MATEGSNSEWNEQTKKHYAVLIGRWEGGGGMDKTNSRTLATKLLSQLIPETENSERCF